MLEKINTINIDTDTLAERAQRVGVALMFVAAAMGIVEFGDHKNGREALVPQTALVSEHGAGQGGEAQRREREETGPHYTSYGINQRTPGRARNFA